QPRFPRRLFAVALGTTLAGCSTVESIQRVTGSRGTDLSALKLGAAQAAVEGALGAPTTTKDLGPILLRSYVYDEGRAPDPLYLLAVPLAVPVDAMFAVPQAGYLVSGDWQKHQESQRAERTHVVSVVYGSDRSVLGLGYDEDRPGAVSPELLRTGTGLDAKA